MGPLQGPTKSSSVTRYEAIEDIHNAGHITDTSTYIVRTIANYIGACDGQ
jgi:hypothetical protein